MAVPSSGELSLRSIHQEIVYSDYSDDDYDEAPAGGYSLTNASNGTYGAINTANDSADRPDGSAPHAMSEFYSYDHSASGTSFTSVFSGFNIEANIGQTQVSSVKTFTVNNGSGVVTAQLLDQNTNSFGTLHISIGTTDPGVSGNAAGSTGFVQQGSTATLAVLSWPASEVIYCRFKFVAHSAAASDPFTARFTVNSVVENVTVTKVSINPGKSDIRLKTNIERIGYSDMNIPIYLFNFKDNLNTTYKGVMAQDLLELGLDNSVSVGHDGYYRVDYNSIDVDMEMI